MKNINYKIFIIGFISVVFNLFLHNFGVYSILETKLYDLRFKIRGPLPDSENITDVVLVEVDDEAYRLIPEPYPYPRGNVWARVVKNLTDAGAKVIAFDIQFDSEDFSYKLLKEAGVALAPGSSFGPYEKYFRLCFSIEDEKLLTAIQKIGEYLP